MNHKEQIEREAGTWYPTSSNPKLDDAHLVARRAFIKGANFALEMVLKELESRRHEHIGINGIRNDVVNWSDIESLLGKFNAGF